MKLLIVDDFAEFLDLEKTFLRRAECEVVTASTGLEAIKVANEQRPDLVVLDVEMPEMNGIEATRIFTKTPELKDIPIVILSSTERDHEAIGAGARAFYKKPIDENTFFKMIRTFVPIKIRQDERKALKIPCKLVKGSKSIDAKIADISTSGALIISPTSFTLGDKVQLNFTIPGFDPIQAEAHVVRKAGATGYGLGFYAISAFGVENIKEYVYS